MVATTMDINSGNALSQSAELAARLPQKTQVALRLGRLSPARITRHINHAHDTPGRAGRRPDLCFGADVSIVVVVSGRTLQQLAVASVEFGRHQHRGVDENILERCRPTEPVWACFIVGDALDQALTKGLPLARVRPAHCHGQAE